MVALSRVVVAIAKALGATSFGDHFASDILSRLYSAYGKGIPPTLPPARGGSGLPAGYPVGLASGHYGIDGEEQGRPAAWLRMISDAIADFTALLGDTYSRATGTAAGGLYGGAMGWLTWGNELQIHHDALNTETIVHCLGAITASVLNQGTVCPYIVIMSIHGD